MNDQLQNLLQRVYDEGVTKARTEADRIIGEAQANAEANLQKAQTEAERIIAEANKKAEELLRNAQSDLKMAGQHTLSSIKQRITELIMDQAMMPLLNKDFNDANFMQHMIMEAITAWKESNNSGHIVITQEMQSKLDEGFLSRLKSVLDGKLVVDFSPVMKSGFMITPLEGGYKLSFTEEDFANLFKSYLRPRMASILFQD